MSNNIAYSNIEPWHFNEKAARIFQKHAFQHIPDYEKVIDLCLKMTIGIFGTRARVLDFGSALGFTIDRFYQAGVKSVFGIEKSKEMRAHSMHQEKIILDDKIPDDAGVFDVIIANWTLHFISDRERIIREFTEHLSEGGIIIITDKVSSSDHIHELYMDFKRENGLSEEEITKKTESLRGVLIPYSLTFYTTLFEEIGFGYDIINATPCFITFSLRKNIMNI